ncbi:MAG: ABC transporter ATP-binding protein [Patescibacteria group bacterium]|jgi:putative ABC transport system ATP-binding protein
MIELINLNKDYTNEEVVTPVLHDINLKIAKGDFLAIMGPSGSGKSTLMHILGFLDTLTTGKYIFQDKDVSSLDDDTLAVYRNQKVGFVFQSFNLLPKTSVWENVRLPLLYAQDADEKKVDQAIASVELTHRSKYLSNQLSGGEKQRVAIARALVNNPDIIFADEPTGNLDSRSGTQIMAILQKLNAEGHTIILVTHETNTAKHAKRIVRIRDGEIVSDEKNDDQIIAEKTELVK